MNRLRILILVIVAGVTFGTAFAEETSAPLPPAETSPKKAPCTVCSFGGAGHGEEKVAASSRFEENDYFFCNEGCKKRFDADPVGYLPPVFPRPAPEVTLETLEGENVSLASYRGSIVLVDFWASWCKPCHKAMPKLAALHRKMSGDGFTVLGVAIDEDLDDARKYAAKKKIDYPVLLDAADAPAWEAFRVKAIPAAYLIDRDGAIVQQWTGKFDTGDIEAELQKHLKTRPGAEPAD